MQQEVKILAFESSCDDTSCAVLRAQPNEPMPKILSMSIQSQNEIHEKFGGVVPELASRAHLENLIPCLEKALAESGVSLSDIDIFAATARPGLVGCLLVGHTAAKTLAYTFNKKFISCNHLESHLLSAYLEETPQFPVLSLLASGGHTSLYYSTDYDHFEVLGQTLDDACGEAFDKGAKLLGLGFPGGSFLEKMARDGNPNAFEFGVVRVEGMNLSFSGLKSQMNRYMQKEEASRHADLAASYQKSIFDHIIAKMNRALEERPVMSLAIVGGVARNQELRDRIKKLSEEFRLNKILIPSMSLCTDNAAMIGARAFRHFLRSEFSSLDDDVGSTSRPPVRHAG